MNDSKKRPLTAEEKREAKALKALYLQWKRETGKSQEEAGAMMGGISQGAVGHYLNGRNPLNATAAAEFAKLVGCAISAFSPRLAAEIESLTEARTEAGDTTKRPGHPAGTTLTGPTKNVTGVYSLSLAPQHTLALGPLGSPGAILQLDPTAPISQGLWLIKLAGGSAPMLFEIRDSGEMLVGVDLLQRLVEMRFPASALEYAHRLVGVRI